MIVLRWYDSYDVMINVSFRISVDDMDIKVEGSAKVTFEPLSVVFDTAVLDLEMWRWTVSVSCGYNVN